MIAKTTSISSNSKKIKRNSNSQRGFSYLICKTPFNKKYKVGSAIQNLYVIPNFMAIAHPIATTIYAHEIFKSSIVGKIDELNSLKDNWDAENSPAPTNNTIDLAKEIASRLIEQGKIINFCYPLRNGGIQLEEGDDNSNCEFEVHPDGTIHELIYDQDYNLVSNKLIEL